MLVEAARSSHIASVVQLAQLTGFVLDIEAELTQSWARLWVAHLEPLEEAPSAFLLAWHCADEMQVIALGTHPECRRRGLAAALVEALIEAARDEKCRLVELEVRPSNRVAWSLYHQAGFANSRRRPRYYSSPVEDGIEMMLALDDEGRLVPMKDEFVLPEE